MELIEKYLPRTQFSSYDDFKANFSVNIPENFDFARDIVDEWAALEPAKKALVYGNDYGEELTLTFSQVSELSKRAATYFTSLGVREGDRVLMLLRRRWEYWVCAVALHRLGAVVVPASIQLKEKDILYRAQISNARLIVAIDDAFVLEQIQNLKQTCPSLMDIVLVGERHIEGYRNFHAEFSACELYEKPNTLTNSDEMVIYFTSGTTGMPKMAVHNRTYPLGHIVTARYMQCVQNNGLHLTQADSGWAKFGWGNIYGQWICGSAVLAYDPDRFDAQKLLLAMEKYQPTSLCIPPTMYRFLLRGGLKREHVDTVQWYSTAGEPLSGEVNKEFYAITGHYIHEGYGQSEGTPISCSFEWLDIRPSSMGRTSPLYDTAIVNQDGTPCHIGEVGEIVIYVRPDQLGLLDCYYAADSRQNPVVNGVYHTGDTAYEDQDGYYWYVGRSDDIIKSSGYRIGPFEIESVLNMHPAIRESAIIGVPDPIRGQVVCAVVSLRDGFDATEDLTKELQSFVKQNTAPYKYPRIIHYIPDLPKTPSGKIMRTTIRKMVVGEA